MQRQLSLSDSEDAISPIIGTVLILAIMVSITGTMLAWGIPCLLYTSDAADE